MLRIYDTRTGQVEEVPPARGVRLYECAPPVDRPAHLGDLRPLLLSDLIRRVLERQRVRMVVCRGVSDLGSPSEAARSYEEAVSRDALALNLRSPEQSPRATEHVAQVRSEEHTSELQSRENLVCRLLLEKKKPTTIGLYDKDSIIILSYKSSDLYRRPSSVLKLESYTVVFTVALCGGEEFLETMLTFDAL